MVRVLARRRLVAVRRPHHLTSRSSPESLLLLLQLGVVGLSAYQRQVVLTLLRGGELTARSSMMVRRVRGEARQRLRIMVGTLRVDLMRQVLLEDVLLVAR